MRTELQAEASRENGSKSHGPVTEEGKSHSSQNASYAMFEQRYGIAPIQTSSEFSRILDQLVDDLKPAGIMQGILLERIATFVYKLRRVARAEMLILEGKLQNEWERSFDTPENQAAFAELVASHEEASGKKFIPPPEPTEEENLATNMMGNKNLDRLLSYELKLQKTLHATLREYQRLQKRQEDLAANQDDSTGIEELIAADARGCTRIRKEETVEIEPGSVTNPISKNDQIEPGIPTPMGTQSYPRESACIPSTSLRAGRGTNLILNEPDGSVLVESAKIEPEPLTKSSATPVFSGISADSCRFVGKTSSAGALKLRGGSN